MPEREQDSREEPVFDRQYQSYKESLEQRGLSEAEAAEQAAERLRTGQGEPGGAHRDRD